WFCRPPRSACDDCWPCGATRPLHHPSCHAGRCLFRANPGRGARSIRESACRGPGMSAVYGIVARDLARAFRQNSRVIGGLARPFMWFLLVGTGYNAIARVEGVSSYQSFIYPGLIVMATLFGSMLTAISTVYDREFGMLRLMLSSPAGVTAILGGRMIAAT